VRQHGGLPQSEDSFGHADRRNTFSNFVNAYHARTIQHTGNSGSKRTFEALRLGN
jgi:hypothetical protein